jgi:transcriptional regulator with XRE-family HTH domain
LNAKRLGQRIRQAREERGLSQDELAVRVSKDQRAISEYELGKRKLAAAELPEIARVLNVPVGYFFDEHAEDEQDRVLLAEFHRLPNATAQRAVIEIVRAFVDTLHRVTRREDQ